MEQNKISKLVLLVLALIFLVIGISYFLTLGKIKNEATPTPDNSDKETAACLDKIPIEGDSLIGVYRTETAPEKDYVDFYYYAYLKSADEEKNNGCEVVKLVLSQEKNSSNFVYSISLPKKLLSLNEQKKMSPKELSNILGNKVDITIRYNKGEGYDENKNLDKILGWKFNKVFYGNQEDLGKIDNFYNFSKE